MAARAEQLARRHVNDPELWAAMDAARRKSMPTLGARHNRRLGKEEETMQQEPMKIGRAHV